jgi:hypothetical protein
VMLQQYVVTVYRTTKTVWMKLTVNTGFTVSRLLLTLSFSRSLR